jgi:hypothetical protein
VRFQRRFQERLREENLDEKTERKGKKTKRWANAVQVAPSQSTDEAFDLQPQDREL